MAATGPGNPPQLAGQGQVHDLVLLKAELPFLIAVLVCGAAFHLVARHGGPGPRAEQEDMLATERWKGDRRLVLPRREPGIPDPLATRTLTSVHGADPPN